MKAALQDYQARMLRVVGNTDNLEPAALYLCHDWLPASGEQARDFPIYRQRLSFPGSAGA
jgi:AraC family transcriptional regulator